MDFRLEFIPEQAIDKIKLKDRIFLIGSCFTDHMYEKFISYKFSCIQNPNGTLFNPISIFDALNSYMERKEISENNLFFQQGLWHNWAFHSSRSKIDREEAVKTMNTTINTAHDFFKKSDVLFITLGSAFVYERADGQIVSNCHKMPATSFKKRLLEPEEIKMAFENCLNHIKAFNPVLKIVFTISPVRHLRDGFVENNRSKAVLIHAVDKILKCHPQFSYFPAYELIIDDLRDYRFFAEDMVHPNYQATRYVWDKFCLSFIEGKTREVMKDLDQIKQAMQHRPMHSDSEEHRKFIHKYREIVSSLCARYPEIQLQTELAYFEQK